MAIEYTFHGSSNNSRNSDDVDALTSQNGAAVAVANGAAGAVLTLSGLYRIVATSACRVRAGVGQTNGSGGAIFAEGRVEVWRLRKGENIGVSVV